MAFSPDGQRILTGSEDKTAKVWEVASGKPLLTLTGHIAAINSVAFSPDGRRVITGSGDQRAGQQRVPDSEESIAVLWEVASGRRLRSFQDAGMGPVELYVGSVASCVAYFVGQFCGRHGIARDGLAVEAEWTMAEGPHRVGRIDIAIHLPHRITSDQRERLLKVAHGCTVHQSISVAPTIGIKLNPHMHHKSDGS